MLVAVILIVEDEVFIRELVILLIQDWGCHTLAASDVNEALLLIRSPQHIDVLFTDINLKGRVLGGCELAQKAVELRPELRVLYTTGNVITAEMKSLFVNGSQFICKPYAPHQLQDAIERLLAA